MPRLIAALMLAAAPLFAAGVAAQAPAVPPKPTTQLPAWAYPIPNPADQAFIRKDDGTPIRMPNSNRTYTLTQIDDNFNPPDWHPEDHPAPPAAVLHGKPPEARACGLCHLPIGTGHPESSFIAGLPKDYMFEQIVAFRNGNRRSSVPLRSRK
jgi:cytochrome c553